MKQSLAIIGAMIGAEACGGTFQDARRTSSDHQETEPVITDSVFEIEETPQSLKEIRKFTHGGTRAVMDPTGVVHLCTPDNWIKEMNGFVPPLYIPSPRHVPLPFEEHTKGAAALALRLGYHDALCKAAKIRPNSLAMLMHGVQYDGEGACLSTNMFPPKKSCDEKIDLSRACDDFFSEQAGICIDDSSTRNYVIQKEGGWHPNGSHPPWLLINSCRVATRGTFRSICEQFGAQREYERRKRDR